jgi:hypothetical protein
LLLLREPYVCNLAAALSQTLKRLHDKNGRMPQIEEQVGPAEVAAAQ